MLNRANRFNIFCFLDNQGYAVAPHRYECLLAIGTVAEINGDHISSLNALDGFLKKGGWYFGHLSYDLKNLLHGFLPAVPDAIGFPLFYFFRPETVCYVKNGQLFIDGPDPDSFYAELMQAPDTLPYASPPLSMQQRLSKRAYIDCIHQLQQRIHRGDCYEINFCSDFFADGVAIDPLAVYHRLMELSPHPFSAFYKWNDSFLLCASPERFLYKDGNRILSQPMKGTAKVHADPGQNEAIKQRLRNDPKERAENIMVVDLVRNDLAKICTEASVRVDELLGIYSYPQVHQMVSTVSGELRNGVTFSEILTALFPMGSMTGAPKHNVMRLIDRYEPGGRGIFSGTVGYINPAGDFDFNVIIRSIMHNRCNRYTAYRVGSGITFYSDAEKEWDECLLKGAAMRTALGA